MNNLEIPRDVEMEVKETDAWALSTPLFMDSDAHMYIRISSHKILINLKMHLKFICKCAFACVCVGVCMCVCECMCFVRHHPTEIHE